MRTILFVCTGNTCRSPMAEAVARAAIQDRKVTSITDPAEVLVASAGVAAMDGLPVAAETLQALENLGIDHQGQSKSLTARMIERAELILCMTTGHAAAAAALVADFPDLARRIHLLSPDGDIADPIGMGQSAYDALSRDLVNLIPARLEHLLQAQRETAMKIAIGSDHRGSDAVRSLLPHLTAGGYETDFVAPCDDASCDYPDSAYRVASAVSSGDSTLGILICGSGIGMSIAANKVHGIRAALALDELTARLARQHNDANVLCLSGNMTSVSEIARIVDAWLEAEFEGGRHSRRIRKITAIEAGEDPTTVSVEEGSAAPSP